MSFSGRTDRKNLSLTRFPRASLRELITLSVPLMFVFFSGTFMAFCDRWFLAQSSTEAMEASLSATYLCLFFQVPCIRIISVSQIFVGQNFGAKKFQSIGSNVWQMIWFSFFTMLITFPLSYIGDNLFFRDTTIHDSASIYFRVMMYGNFLFPLATSLATFYVGQGRTKIVFLTTVCANMLNILLDILFIFGVPGLIPAMGVFGAALGTIIAQVFLCIALFIFFIQRHNRERFGTHRWRVQWGLMRQSLRIGVPRAVSRIIILGIWLCTARVMMLQGGDFLLVLSVGGSIALFFSFIGEGMSQAVITIGSNLIGAAEFDTISRLTRSAFFFVCITSIFLLGPLVIYPKWILSFFLIGDFSPQTWTFLYHSCYWLWFYFFSLGINHIGHSLLVASKDTFFHMVVITFNFLTTYIPVSIFIHYWNALPDKLWLIMAFDCLVFGLLFLARFHKRQKWKDSVASASN